MASDKSEYHAAMESARVIKFGDLDEVQRDLAFRDQLGAFDEPVEELDTSETTDYLKTYKPDDSQQNPISTPSDHGTPFQKPIRIAFQGVQSPARSTTPDVNTINQAIRATQGSQGLNEILGLDKSILATGEERQAISKFEAMYGSLTAKEQLIFLAGYRSKVDYISAITYSNMKATEQSTAQLSAIIKDFGSVSRGMIDSLKRLYVAETPDVPDKGKGKMEDEEEIVLKGGVSINTGDTVDIEILPPLHSLPAIATDVKPENMILKTLKDLGNIAGIDILAAAGHYSMNQAIVFDLLVDIVEMYSKGENVSMKFGGSHKLAEEIIDRMDNYAK
ncbi:TPA_asm: protein 2 [Streptoglossa virus 1]|uniref:Protein 2 n=1 Tax=Streptoglossa virus 1 TaxID=2977992 RepID=A0A9N6YIY7_9RHAB|nr:TPA_asm: protein 2 [Streptoglossa virus 1]